MTISRQERSSLGPVRPRKRPPGETVCCTLLFWARWCSMVPGRNNFSSLRLRTCPSPSQTAAQSKCPWCTSQPKSILVREGTKQIPVRWKPIRIILEVYWLFLKESSLALPVCLSQGISDCLQSRNTLCWSCRTWIAPSGFWWRYLVTGRPLCHSWKSSSRPVLWDCGILG